MKGLTLLESSTMYRVAVEKVSKEELKGKDLAAYTRAKNKLRVNFTESFSINSPEEIRFRAAYPSQY